MGIVSIAVCLKPFCKLEHKQELQRGRQNLSLAPFI